MPIEKKQHRNLFLDEPTRDVLLTLAFLLIGFSGLWVLWIELVALPLGILRSVELDPALACGLRGRPHAAFEG